MLEKHLKDELINTSETYRYQLLGRLKADCDYFLNTGSKHFWSGDERDQIEVMKILYETFPADKKPEWLNLEQIKEYENKIVK